VARAVRLLGVPVDTYWRATQHTDELLREFTLITIGGRAEVADRDIPKRLLGLMEDLRERHTGATGGIRAQFEQAGQRGEATIDIELPADELVADITDTLTDMLDEADEFCRQGNLLTIASDPDVVAWRHWWRDEVVGQIRNGAEPQPFRAGGR